MFFMRRYLRYADAGDQFVGRAIALVGFLNSWKFAVLPPHFVEDVTPVVLALFPICAAMPNMIPVCRMALASVVFHGTKAEGGFDFAPNHELMKSALFSDRGLLENLRQKLNSDLYKSDHITATGIPPYVCLFMEIAGIPARVREVFTEVLRGVNIIPRADESALLQEVMSKLTGIEARLTTTEVQRTAPRCEVPAGVQAVYNSKLKRFSCLPEGYQLPKKLIDLFNHWFCASTYGACNVPPLRSACVSVLDFETSQHRAWSDCKTVMRIMQQKMDARTLQVCTSEVVSVTVCTNVYANGMHAKVWGVLSNNDNARMKVSYACKLLQGGGVTGKRKRKDAA
jgi:hypothetical protein